MSKYPEGFEKAFPAMIAHEGGYVNDPVDSGGETYKGVSRNNWPKWGGWKIIDELKAKGIKKAKDINDTLKNDEGMLDLVKEFYYVNFWEPLE